MYKKEIGNAAWQKLEGFLNVKARDTERVTMG
jgi:hypothetical protein